MFPYECDPGYVKRLSALPRVCGEPTISVECDECSGRFLISMHRHRDHRKRGTQPRCRICRTSAPRFELTDEEREEYVRFWIEESGLSRRELREIARAIA